MNWNLVLVTREVSSNAIVNCDVLMCNRGGIVVICHIKITRVVTSTLFVGWLHRM